MASTITFPTTEYRRQLTKSDASLVPRHNTAAIEVCNLVYNQADPVSWDTLSRFYEADAGKVIHPVLIELLLIRFRQCKPHVPIFPSLHILSFTPPCPSYENPVITATSRDAIGDVHSLSQHFAEIDAPKPTSLLRSLVGWACSPAERESWFQISRMWTEVEEVCENEIFGESSSGQARAPDYLSHLRWIGRCSHHRSLVRWASAMHCGAHTQYTSLSWATRTLFRPHERRSTVCLHVRCTA